ncbi:MAG TPA: ectonucleotide pyrophosphatase/phosphodiesterase [Verrucomicrobiae bacterium]|nr:ectonucleotide pyrophosphatase/phosphodiesterase [Verrucomicrobiae bacterium]
MNRLRLAWSFWLTFVFGLVCSWAALGQTGAPTSGNHVIVISLGGLRPEFYLPGPKSKACETLVELRNGGSCAKGALPPYPSVAYPGHATMVTGVSPARHGITANTRFEPPATEGRGFWFASDLQAPALWDLAHQAGRTVATVSWPSTAGSKSIDWNLPEFWTTPLGSELALMRQYATPGLISQIEQSAGSMQTARNRDAGHWDAFLTAAAATIIREHRPDLLYVHLIQADKVQHKGGRSAPELPEAMRQLDSDLYDIIQATKQAGTYESTAFVVVGDHGFSDVSEAIAPNVVLSGLGFITQDKAGGSWKAMVHSTGGSAAVYLKDPNDATTAAQVRGLLANRSVGQDGKRIYSIIDKEQLTKLGGPRDAAFFLEAEPGHMFVDATTGEFVRPAPVKGNHGYLPEKPEMRTGFLAAGRGIKTGVVLDTIRLADVAPTVAELLGINMKNTEGRVLTEILE